MSVFVSVIELISLLALTWSLFGQFFLYFFEEECADFCYWVKIGPENVEKFRESYDGEEVATLYLNINTLYHTVKYQDDYHYFTPATSRPDYNLLDVLKYKFINTHKINIVAILRIR